MPVSETLSALVLKGSAELGATLINAYAKRSLENNSEKIAHLKSNITPHIDATFSKCSVIKTLLNPQHPANFLSIYATQRFVLSNKTFDHYGMVEHIRKNVKNLILTGTGGSGKSMFTRYLWLSLFVHSEGKIPLFIELRNINNISMENIISYIHSSVSQGQSILSEKDYHSFLKNGDFVILLDGFDEIVQDKKEYVQKQIIFLVENYPKLKVIVTSRPDDRFSSWPSFDVAHVAPLQREDVVELIELAEFSEDYKNSFLKRLKTTDLFSRHNSFLTNPLLASMMLLTFSHNFDIPDRIHLFYQQAFDALYQRHDSYKPGGFKRQFRTTLSEDVFKRILSYFCLITYYNEKFAFSRDEAIFALKDAITISGAASDPIDLLEDLVSCVCFLIVEGLQYTFSHRSFQEYFAAYCMAYVNPDRFEGLVTKFSSRVNDQVIMLLSDMNPEALRRLYILPLAKRFTKAIQIENKRKSVAMFFESAEQEFTLQLVNSPPRGMEKFKGGTLKDDTAARRRKGSRVNNKEVRVTLSGESEFWTYVRLIERLYKKEKPEADEPIAVVSKKQEKDEAAVRGILNALNVLEGHIVQVIGRKARFSYVIGENEKLRMGVSNEDKEYFVRKDIDDIFEKSYMYEYFYNKLQIVGDYVSKQKSLEKSASNAMSDLFKS